MIKSITAINYLGEGLELELTAPEKSGLYVQSVTGIGGNKATINTTDLASDDGGIFSSARAETRNIVLTLGMFDWKKNYPNWSIEDARHLTYKIFPKKKGVTLVFKTDNRTTYIDGYVESNEPDIFTERETTQISIICPDPNFYSTSSDSSYMGAVQKLFKFPFENNTIDDEVVFVPGIPKENQEFLSYTPSQTVPGVVGKWYYQRTAEDSRVFNEWIWTGTQWYLTYENKRIDSAVLVMSKEEENPVFDIVNQGEIEVGAVFVIHFSDRATNIRIYNPDTNELTTINTGYVESVINDQIISGDEIEFSTKPGDKYCIFRRNGIEHNVINAIAKGHPAWFKFSQGTNRFTYYADEGKKNIQVEIRIPVAYEGV